MITLGLDIGSVAAKGVLLAPNDKWQVVVPTGWSPRDAGQQIIAELTRSASLERLQIDAIVATGYGRISVPDANKSITEITCHAKGLTSLLPEVRTIIDIGGQDSKVIKLNESGRVIDFAMNDKCAAGTGRFISNMAVLLGYDLKDFSDIPPETEIQTISSMCTVFAESEVISLLSKGVPKESIALGLLDSIASRAAGMVIRISDRGPVVLTGGPALNKKLATLISKHLGRPVLTSELAQFSGAIGAALIAVE
ncbi:MAG TPA: 2-hydroxyglutaryl-CoA dehydratase [Firmicutes bacterium]|nr:2-hydroxyglutaryl-CoA dehydratase [Bacillota bacterium]